MPVFHDQTGRSMTISGDPRRIISLVPSQTELLHDLGLNEEVIGITKFCVHPEEWFHNKIKLGGTKKLDMKKIHQLKPDLIIANKEENVKEQIEELEKYYPVWISDVKNLEDACKMINQLGLITGKERMASQLISNIKKEFLRLNPKAGNAGRNKTCYLIWRNPYMTAGGDTFINSMMELGGFENIYKEQDRYPIVRIEELKNSDPEFVLLSSEPFPFKQKHIAELQPRLPRTKIILVDGEIFSWYGSRLLKAPEYFLMLQKQFSHIE
jgi:ABC-type Fe3+-hydroxamate transport system substrate-binding protein